MDHTVWIKEEYGDTWQPSECGDLEAAKREILEATKVGKEVRLTVEVPFSLELKVGEPGTEAKKAKTRGEKVAREILDEEERREADQDQAEPDQNPAG